jgi:hypothetical protein
MNLDLPASPLSVLDANGLPRFGTYQGELASVDLSGLREPFEVPEPRRTFAHKRWIYALVATPEVMVVMGIADLGYSSHSFSVAVDLLERRVLSDDAFLGPPGPLGRVGDSPGRGLSAYFRTLGGRFSLHRPVNAERFALEAELMGLRAHLGQPLRLRAEVLAEGGPPALSVVAPVKNGWVNVTQKRAGLLSFGTLLAGGRTYGLDGGVAGLDYTQGLLARRTAWKWAMAVGRMPDGTPVGLNLVEGFNEGEGANENAFWIGSRLVPLAPAHFTHRRDDPLEPWRIVTTDGSLELDFRPIHVHREHRDLKIVRSDFLQPLGHFNGTLKLDDRIIKLERLAGVTEDQAVVW